MKLKRSIYIILSIICYFTTCFMIYKVNAQTSFSASNLTLAKSSYGDGYIYGEIVSEKKPNIVFKSTDGSIKKEVYIEKRGNNKYYFDRHLVEIDFSKTYIFEVDQKYKINLGSNRILGKHIDYQVEINNSEIKLKDYIPSISLKSLNLGKTSYGGGYIYGEMTSEYHPNIIFKSVDGKIKKEVYLEYRGNNKYYFDRHLVELPLGNNYVFEVRIGKSVQNIKLGSNRVLGVQDGKKVTIKNNQLELVKYEYNAIPKVNLKNINLGTTASKSKYIYGEIEYYELENGTNKLNNKLPKIIFKSTDGTEEKDVYIQYKGNNVYYFDRHIIELDMNKQYIFEVKTGEKSNTNKETTNIILGYHNLGLNTNEYKIYTQNDKVMFSYEDYDCVPQVTLKEIHLGNAQYGNQYIYGKIDYKEVVNGSAIKNISTPKIVFKSTDGSIEKEVYINKINDTTFYFDRHIIELDYNKQYSFYIKSETKRNKNHEYIKINLGNRDLGITNKYRVKVNGTNVYFTENKDRYNGIDVSSWQGDIDWAKVKKENIDFAIIRVGYRGYGTGKLVVDKKFEQNIVGAKNNNINTGVYFATHAINVNEGIEEANYTINNIKKYNITGPVVIDTESSGDNGRADNLSKSLRTQIVKAFCETIKNAGYTPMIYASKYWLRDNLDMSQLGYYDVWLAHYTGSKDKPSDYNGNYTIWQYTSSGRINGIYTNVDMNVGYKSY